MKHLTIFATLGLLAFVPPALATGVRVNDPTGQFSDSSGNQGYVQVTDDGVQACNENPDTPAGDELTGYVYVSSSGQTPGDQTHGNEHVGIADADGDDHEAPDGSNPNDCPAAAENTAQPPAP